MPPGDHTVVLTSPCPECSGTGERIEMLGGQQVMSASGGPLTCKRCNGTLRISQSVTLADLRCLMELDESSR